MAGANFCVSCAQLPRKDRSLAFKTMRCPDCKAEFGVTSYGATFRFLPPKQNLLLSRGFMTCAAVGAGLLTLVLVLVGMGLWSGEVAIPKRVAADPPVPDEFSRIREVAVADPFGQNPDPHESKERIKRLIHDIKVTNANPNNPDAFVLARMEARPELKGLPFIMGAACRMEGNKSLSFDTSVKVVRESMDRVPTHGDVQGDETVGFWDHYQSRSNGQGVSTPHGVAALTQILGPERVPLRHSLVKKLAQSQTPEATRAIARAALFDVSADVRRVAVAELKKRPKDHNYDDILMHGIRYPMANVAHRAAYTINQLERKDLLPQLAVFLDEAAPGDPEKKIVDNKEVCEVREVVRVNHHRNCLLCHPPSFTGQPNEVPGVIPIPGIPFGASPSESYGSARSLGDPMIRADATYLRQDFSVLMAVANAAPWPEMQRFDFLVRTRVVDGSELKALAQRVASRPAGFLSENHKAALEALRTLTGQNAAPNPAAWQRVLGVGLNND